MLQVKNKTMFEMAQIQSIREFHKKNESGTTNIAKPMEPDGSIAVPIDFDQEITKKLLTELRSFPVEGMERNEQFFEPHNMIDRITNGLIEINEYMDFDTCINTIYSLYKDLGKEKFYGVFLVDELGNKHNPLHHIVAMEFMDQKPEQKFKMYIYTYPETKKSYALNRFERTEDKAKIKENVAAQIAVYSGKLQMAQKINGNRSVADLIHQYHAGNEPTLVASSAYTITDSDGKSVPNKTPMLMIPITLVNTGLIMPWYGTTLVTMNGSSAGHPVSPMMSANISSNTEYLQKSKTAYPSYGICTGRQNSRTIKGLRTLNHANLNSPLNRQCLTPGWRDYVEECVAFSFMAYESIITDYDGEAIMEDMAVPVFKNYLDEWKHHNPDGTMKDYISHLKNRKTNKEN